MQLQDLSDTLVSSVSHSLGSEQQRSLLGSSRLRFRILVWVLGLVTCSAMGSALSVVRLMEVHRQFESFRGMSVPLGQMFSRLKSDSAVMRRELDRRASAVHWGETPIRPRSFPVWTLLEIKKSFVELNQRLSHAAQASETSSKVPAERKHWENYELRVNRLSQRFEVIQVLAQRVQDQLSQDDSTSARQTYTEIFAQVDLWGAELDRLVGDFERTQQVRVDELESSLKDLRAGLLLVFAVVLGLSVLLLWFGERALRPLERLAALAREITQRGALQVEHKRELEQPGMLFREDEIGELSTEFRRMATTLLEREKTVQSQKRRLEEQNQKLLEMGALNQGILSGFRGLILVLGPHGEILSTNELAQSWLQDPGAQAEAELRQWFKRVEGSSKEGAPRIEKLTWNQKVFSGTLFRLPMSENLGSEQSGSSAQAQVMMLEDMTDSLALEEKLHLHEHLVGLGRMSAQVAHEVRNPLHSIGLEAEMALESLQESTTEIRAFVTQGPHAERSEVLAHLESARHNVTAILEGVERLESVTQKYLRLSRAPQSQVGSSVGGLSDLNAAPQNNLNPEFLEVNLVEVLESVLASHSTALRSSCVQVDWMRKPLVSYQVRADRELLEQAIGNLLRNGIEAQESCLASERRIFVELGAWESGRVYLRLEDQGAGVDGENIDALFRPFFTTKATGTGLGLAFVRQVLEAMGGEVRYLGSGKRLKGASFEIVLLPTVEKTVEGVSSQFGGVDGPL